MMASTALEGALDIVAWPGYIESGESDKAYDWVSQFEAQTGCKVTVKTAGTSDEMVSLMASGGPQPSPPGDASWPPPGNAPYDLVTASGDASLRLIRGGTVQPVAVDRVPSYSSIDPAPAEGRLALRRRQTLWRALPVGPERVVVQHRDIQEAADLLVGGVRAAEASRRQAQQGPRAGLRRRLSTSPTPRCTSRPRSRSSASRIRTSSTKRSTQRCSRCCVASIR